MSVCLCDVRVCCFFFFKQKTAYEMRISDWSSDVCSSDLGAANRQGDVIVDHQIGEEHQVSVPVSDAEGAFLAEAADQIRVDAFDAGFALFAPARHPFGDRPAGRGIHFHNGMAVAEIMRLSLQPTEAWLASRERPEDRKSTRLNSSH